jgi:hypothetical protein
MAALEDVVVTSPREDAAVVELTENTTCLALLICPTSSSP